MKKTLIACAIASGLAGIAHAETTLYGSLEASVNYNDQYGTAFEQDDGNWDVTTQSSKFGIMGTEDLGNGLTAAYQYEFKVQTSDGGKDGLKTRLAWVGLVGNFGTVALGRQTLPYYNVIGFNDVFNADFSYDGYYLLGIERLSNALAYVSPSFSGFQIQAAVVMAGDNDAISSDKTLGNEDDIDAFTISAIYDNAGWFAGLTYVQAQIDKDNLPAGASRDVKDLKIWGGAIGYRNDTFQIGLVGEMQLDKGQLNGSWEDAYEINLAGEYYYGDHTFRAAVAYLDDDSADDDGWFGALGYQYDFSKRTAVWVEGAYFDGGDSGVFGNTSDGHQTNPDYDGFTVSVGLRHDF